MRMRGGGGGSSDQSEAGIVDGRHVKREENDDQNAEDMTEDNNQQPVHVRHPPLKDQQDCNFNCPTAGQLLDLHQQSMIHTSRLSNDGGNGGSGGGGGGGGLDENPTTNLDCTSSSGYQWFLDYGYKDMDNSTNSIVLNTNNGPQQQRRRRRRGHQPPSIFAALHSPNRSFAVSRGSVDLTYEDLARNIDANLAEIDMEDFRSEDINSILALPAMYCGDFRSENNGERAASPLSGSIVAKVDAFAVDPSSSTTSSTTTTTTTSSSSSSSSNSNISSHHSNISSCGGDSTDMSVCKSELLFSPIKENALPNLPAFSVDSLDCDSYDEQELMLTCQANMNNYTIAFEGSYMKYSDDSDYHEAEGVGSETTDSAGGCGGGCGDSWSGGGQFKLRSSDSVDGSLVQSDCGYTTWSKLRRGGNDVVVIDEQTFRDNVDGAPSPSQPPMMQGSATAATTAACKSQSLPNLFRKSVSSGMKISQLNVSTDSDDQCVPLYDVQQSSQITFDAAGGGVNQSRTSDCSSQQSVSLMRLFIQQKANSSGTPSVAHSLSSGTLHHSDQPYDQRTPSDAVSSLDERLQNFLAAKLTGSQLSDNLESANEMMADAAMPMGLNTLQQHTKTADATMNALKRRMKSTSTAACKLYGGEAAFHEDGHLMAAITPPLASPIEEEDEDERSQWSNYLEDVNGCVADSITDELIEQRTTFNRSPKSSEGGGGDRNERRTSPQTRPSTNNRMGSCQCQVDAGCSSSSSGYVSVRSSMERRQSTTTAAAATAAVVKHPGKNNGGGDHRRFQLVGKNFGTQIPVPVRDEAIQTSFRVSSSCRGGLERILSESAKVRFADRFIQVGCGGCDTRPIYVCRPKSALPDLGFLRQSSGGGEKLIDTSQLFLAGDNVLACCSKASNSSSSSSSSRCNNNSRPTTCPPPPPPPSNLSNVDVSHIQDWDSLNVLLPNEFREKLATMKSPERKNVQNLNEDNSSVDETKSSASPKIARRRPPPLPKRSVSLPQGDTTMTVIEDEDDDNDSSNVATKPPLPKGILRRPNTVTSDGRKLYGTKRYSMPEFLATMQQEVTHSPSCHSESSFKVKRRPSSQSDSAHNIGSREVVSQEEPQQEQQLDVDHHCCGCQLVQFELKAKKMVSFSSNVHVGNTQQGDNPLIGDIEKQDIEKEWPSNVSKSPDGDDPPQVFCVSPTPENTDSNMKISLNFQRNKALVLTVNGAVGVIGAHFNQARDRHEKFILGNSIQTPSVVRKLLDHLCPALYGILNDGLQPEVYNMFGHMDNTVWLVVEAFAQSGNCNKQMSDLFIHVNNDQSLWEKKMKFSAFVFGLLNIRSLDTWFAALGASNKVLQKHYLPEAFLRSTPMTSSKSLFDDLLMTLQRLSMLPFELDLSPENHHNRKNLQFHSSHPSPIGHCFGCTNTMSAMTHLSKSIPEMFAFPDLIQRPANCNCFGHNSELCCPNHNAAAISSHHPDDHVDKLDDAVNLDEKRVNDRAALRRGHSQDSAIATASSGYSNDTVSSYGDIESGTALARQILCHRCSVGGWMTTDFTSRSIENRRRSDYGKDNHRGVDMIGLQKVDGSEDQAVAAAAIEPSETLSTSSDSVTIVVDTKISPMSSSPTHTDTQNNNVAAIAVEEDGAKFKQLRLKWENMSTPTTPELKQKATSSVATPPLSLKSKIPRLVTKRI